MRLTDPSITSGDRTDPRLGDKTVQRPVARTEHALSRRAMLQHSGAAAAGVIVAGALGGAGGKALAATAGAAATSTRAPTAGSDDLRPHDAIDSILAAMDRFPLVALGERHMIQEMHDLYTALLRHPALPGKIDDIVVEFGNALYQDVADRFILGDRPVARADLAQIWRFTIGGGVYWDAPVYEQFFRTVRAANWMLPPARRLRVLLGDPPFDHRKVRGVAGKGYFLSMQSQRDAHYAARVEPDVLRKR